MAASGTPTKLCTLILFSISHSPATSGVACILRQLSECFLYKESFFIAVSPPVVPGMNHEAMEEEKQPQPKVVARETEGIHLADLIPFSSKKRGEIKVSPTQPPVPCTRMGLLKGNRKAGEIEAVRANTSAAH